MPKFQLLPPQIAEQSISHREIVLPLNAAIAAINYCANNKIQILGWEGWIQASDGRVGHGNAPQGTTSLGHLSIRDAADFCRRTIRGAALEWSETNLGTTDRLHFCLTVEVNDAETKP